MKQDGFFKRIIRIILTAAHFFERLSDDKVNAFSAQAAFFVIISFFPFAMLFLTLLNYVPFTAETEHISLDFLSPAVKELVSSVLHEIYQKASGAVVSITSLTALWSASKGLLSIVNGLNSVYGVKEKRGFIKLRLILVFYMVVFIAILIVALALLVFGGSINNWLSQNIPGFENMSRLLLGLRWLMGLCLFTLFFMFLYTAVPERKTRFVSEFPGAFVSACGWLGFSALYSFYIENFGNFSYLYGSLTAVVLLMLWLYFCMYIVFVGAEVNDFLQEKNTGEAFRNWLRAKKKPYYETVFAEKTSPGDFPAAKPASENKARFKGKTVLLAEDDYISAEIAFLILTEQGFNADVAYNGEEAVNKFVSSPERFYDCILMDLQMPIMNGFEASSRIRSLTRADASSIPIIALSADTDPDNISAAKAAGMNSYIAKPINSAALFETLERFLNT